MRKLRSLAAGRLVGFFAVSLEFFVGLSGLGLFRRADLVGIYGRVRSRISDSRVQVLHVFPGFFESRVASDILTGRLTCRLTSMAVGILRRIDRSSLSR